MEYDEHASRNMDDVDTAHHLVALSHTQQQMPEEIKNKFCGGTLSTSTEDRARNIADPRSRIGHYKKSPKIVGLRPPMCWTNLFSRQTLMRIH